MRWLGEVICRERLRRNWSQDGLCRGICAVSYLSKIEKGRAEPSREIARLLLERLGLRADAEACAEAERLAGEGLELLLCGDTDALEALLAPRDPDRYRATPSGLDILLLRGFCGDGPQDEALEGCMERRQLALQRVLQGREDEAEALFPCAFTSFRAGRGVYERGDYPAAVERLQTAYDRAAREGAPRLMLLSRVFIGNCFSNRGDPDGMRRHYAVARRLARALGESAIMEDMDYNLASTDMEAGRWEQAYAYFASLRRPRLLALHKKAICCERTGRRAEALAALDAADAMESAQPDTRTARLLCDVVRFRLEHEDYLARADYGDMLLSAFEACRARLPAGYAAFHLPWVLEWLEASRQYKRACAILRDFPGYRA